MGQEEFTQEAQLTSPGSSPLQWIGGLYLLKANAFEGPVNVWSGIPISEPANAAVLNGRTHIGSYAGYGQAGYEWPHGFELIAGVRTTYERRQLTEQRNFTTNYLDPAVRAQLGLPSLDTPKGWTSTDPKVTFEWHRPGQLLYATYSTGFKAGSYNFSARGSPGPLDPENDGAYEGGGKHDLPFLNHAQLDWAVFYYHYDNMQVSVQDPATGGIDESQNAASSINKGVDMDLAVRVVRNLTATVGMEYLEARYESYPGQRSTQHRGWGIGHHRRLHEVGGCDRKSGGALAASDVHGAASVAAAHPHRKCRHHGHLLSQ